MFCSSCGAKVDEKDNACSYCGASLNNNTQANSQPQQPQYQQNYQPQHQNNNYMTPMKPPNYVLFLVFAIIEALSCSMPFGILAIIFNEKAKTAFMMQDVVGYEKNKKTTVTMLILGVALPIVLFVAYFIFVITLGALGSGSEFSSF